MTGKEKCNLLKQIRKEIADKNGIAFEPAHCPLDNPMCLGTCPRCDEEIKYLDAQLSRKAEMGGKLNIAGLSPAILQGMEKQEPFWGKKTDRPPVIPPVEPPMRPPIVQGLMRPYNPYEEEGNRPKKPERPETPPIPSFGSPYKPPRAEEETVPLRYEPPKPRPNGVFQTMGLIREPSDFVPETVDEVWGFEDEDNNRNEED